MSEECILRLQASQCELENAFRLETNLDEAKTTEDGNKLLKYINKRRRIVCIVGKFLDHI